jgi:hypothetical protein
MLLNCLGQNAGNGIALPVIVTHLYEILIGGLPIPVPGGFANDRVPVEMLIG